MPSGSVQGPAASLATAAIPLSFADERSVMQTRFATSVLTLLRAHLGENVGRLVADAEVAVRAPLPVAPAQVEQITFLGRGWTIGLAHEAALKCREAAGFWAESYPAMDYRHGPISIADPAAANRRNFWTGGKAAKHPDKWLATAETAPGSWWPHWAAWLAARDPEQVPARIQLGSPRYPVLEPAPGRYVKERCEDISA